MKIVAPCLSLALLLFAVAAPCGEPLKTWSYAKLDDVRLSAAPGNEASLRLSPDVKTPDGRNVLEVSLKDFAPDAVPWSVQLKFVYAGGLKEGRSYEVSFLCKASVPGPVQMTAAQSGKPWEPLPEAQGSFEASQDWQLVKLSFKARKDWSEPLDLPRLMLAGYGDSATLFFGPAALRDLSDPQSSDDGPNLIFNPSFELGSEGYAFTRYLQPELNPEMKYEGPSVDAGSAAIGKCSLKIPNRFGEEVRLYPHEVSLLPGTAYTFSVWLKADKPGVPVGLSFLSASGHGDWTGHGAKFVAGTDWKRFSFTFTTKPNAAFDSYILWLAGGLGKDAVPATIWVDGLQLAQGKTRDFVSGSGLECVCVPSESFVVSKDGKASVKAVLKALSNSPSPCVAKLAVAAVEDSKKTLAFSKSFEIPLASGELKTVDFEMPVEGYGSYLLDVKQEGSSSLQLRSQASCFGIIGEVPCERVDLDKRFSVAFNGPDNYICAPHVVSKPNCFRVVDGGLEDYAGRIGGMGCRLLRVWAGNPKLFSWQTIESKEGEFDFRYPDLAVDLFLRHGVELMPVLDPGFMYLDPPPAWMHPEPAWMLEMRKNGVKADAVTDSAKGREYRIVPMAKWRSFVRVVAEHFKGRVSHYEITNEPNLFCPSAKIYDEHLKAATEELRKADPSAKAVAFCSTGDKGGNAEGFLEDCFKLGGLDSADIVSWHPYYSRELSSSVPADRQISNIKALLARYGKPGMPLWNTEDFFLYGTAWDDLPPYKPQHAARRFLTDLGEGVGQSMPVEECTVWKDVITPNFKYPSSSIIATQLLPSSNYVVYNALSRFFEGAKPLGKFRWGDRSICYAFERDGELLAAFWNYSSRGNPRVRLPEDAAPRRFFGLLSGGLRLFDMFGNELPFDGRELVVDPAPRYLKWKGGDAGSVLSALRGAVVSDDKPFRVERALFLKDDGSARGSALLSVRNLSGERVSSVKGSVSSPALSGGAVAFDLGSMAPAELKIVETPVAFASGFDGKANLKASLSGAAKPFSGFAPASFVKSLALTEGVASRETPVEKPAIGKPDSPEDLSASFSLKFERDVLQATVKVRDDKRGAVSPKGRWDEDAIQIYLDAAPLQGGPSFPGYDEHVHHLTFSVSRDGAERLDAGSFPGPVAASVATVAGGYVATIEIPLSAIPGLVPLDGKRIGFDISIEDSDGSSRKTELVWSGSADDYKDRSQFGLVQFKAGASGSGESKR